ncbi:MAG: adenylate/guanylate cyclase domain-containing protein [Candidatus Ozemobacteraceae bacterium]
MGSAVGNSDEQIVQEDIFSSGYMNRLKSTFGDGISKELFSHKSRGKAFAVIFQGEPSLLVWDIIFRGPKPLAAFCLLFPFESDPSLQAIRLLLENWKSRFCLPAFLPLSTFSEAQIPSPPIVSKKTGRDVLVYLKKLQKQMRLTSAPYQTELSPVVNILGSSLGKLQKFGNNPSKWAFLTPVSPLTGMVGVLFRPGTIVPDGFLMSLTWVSAVVVLFGWLCAVTYAMLFRSFYKIGVRIQLYLWFAGIAGMSLAFSLGSASRYISDLEANKTHQLGEELTTNLDRLEAFVNGAANKRYSQCLKKLDRFETAQVLLNAQKRNISSKDAMGVFERLLIKENCRPSAIAVTGYKNFHADKLVSSADVSPVAWKYIIDSLNALRVSLFQRKDSDIPPAILSLPEEKSVEGPQTQLGKIHTPNASVMKWGREQVTAFKGGTVQFLMGTKFIHWQGRIAYLITAFWSHQNLFEKLFKEILKKENEEFKSQDLFFSVFHLSAGSFRDLGEDSSTFFDLRKYARRAILQPVWEIRERENDLVFAYSSRLFPEFILVGRASRGPIQNLLIFERVRTCLLLLALLCLFALLAHILSRRISTPVLKMTNALTCIADGNLQVTIQEDRKDELGKTGHDLEVMTQWLREREKMSRFVSPQVLDVVGAGGYAKAMHGSERVVAFLASDIRNFTTISEIHSPQEVFSTLNMHMDQMTQVIQLGGGAIDRFIGDAIQAVFYADGLTNPSLKALRTAIGMKKRHLQILEERKDKGLFPYEIGFGIDSGMATVGVTGDPETRLDFSVLGNPVQTAPKLEASSKQGRHSKIVVSENVKLETEEFYSFQLIEGTSNYWELASLSEQSVKIQSAVVPAVIPSENGQDGFLRDSDHPLEVDESTISFSNVAPTSSESPGKRLSLPLILLLCISFVFFSVILFFWREKNKERLEENKRQEIRETLLSLKNTLQPTFQVNEMLNRFCLSSDPSIASVFKKQLRKFAIQFQKICPGFALYFFAHDSSAVARKDVQFCLSNHLKFVWEKMAPENSRQASITGFFSFFLSAVFSEEKPLDAVKIIDFTVFDLNSKKIKSLIDMEIADLGFIRPRSLGKCQVLSMKSGSYAFSWNLFWKKDFWQNAKTDLEKGLLGGIMFFIPEEQLTSRARWLCFLANQKAKGNEVAVFSDAPVSRMLYATRKFRDNRAFRTSLGISRETFQHVDDWIVGQTLVSLEKSYRILIASRTESQSYSQRGLWTSLFFLSCIGAIIGIWAICNCVLLYQKSTLSLGMQMVGTFAFLLIHCLIFGGVLQNDALQEMLIRLKTEKKQDQQDALSDINQRNSLFSTYACRLLKERIRQSSFVNELDRRIKQGKISEDYWPNNNFLLEFGQWMSRRGIKVYSLGLFSPSGCFGSMNFVIQLKQAIFSIFEQEWRSFPGNEERKKGKKAAEALMAEEITQLFRWLIPPIEFASWVNAPQSLTQIFWMGDRDLYLFSRKGIAAASFSFRLHCCWESQALLFPVFQELTHTAEVDLPPSHLRCGFLESPGFSMTPPFGSYPHDWEYPSPSEGSGAVKIQLGHEIMSVHAPEFCHLLNYCSEAGELVTEEKGDLLMSAVPGSKLPRYSFFTWSSLSPALTKFEMEMRNVQSFFIALSLFGLGFAFIAARYFLSPLTALSAGAGKIMTRDFQVRLPTDRTDEFGELAEAFNLMAQKLQEGKILRQFVSDSVQTVTEGTSREMIAGKGEKVEAVILFSALGCFKQKLETSSPQALVPQLNYFLGKMALIIKNHGGDIDKFIGEKILAVFHAEKCGSLAQAQKNATEAALVMQDEMERQTFWGSKSLGIGIVPGGVLAGILGTASVRLEYTVIGDRVNLASRLCDLALGFESGIVLEKQGKDLILDVLNLGNRFQLKEMGEMKIKGKSEKIETYRLWSSTKR